MNESTQPAALTPEQLAEIRDRKVPLGPGAVWTLKEDKDALLAEVERLKAEATKATRWEIHLAETLHNAQLNEGELSAEVEQLRTRAEALRVNRDQLKAKLTEADALIAELVRANGGEQP